MLNKKLTIFVLLLLLVSIVNANIDIFSYGESQSKNNILNNMDLAILNIEDQGYDSRRFVDIYNEAEFYSADDNMFFRTASLFRNTTILASNTIKEFEKINSQINVLNELKKVNESILNKLNQASEYISESKYESSVIIFSELEPYISTESEQLFIFVQQKYWDVEYEYNLLTITTEVMNDINIRLPNAKKSVLVAKELIDELQNINVSVQHIIAIKNHLKYFEDNSINTKQLDDLYEETLYNFDRKRYDKISALYEESKSLYNKALTYKKEYQETHAKVGSLKESDKKTEFESDLAVSYNLYKNSEVDNAIEKLENLNEDILDFESQLIAFTNINIAQIPVLTLLKQNLVAVIGTIIVIIILSIIVTAQVKRYVHVKMIKRYESEKKNLEQLMKDLQFKYYDEKTISKKQYESKIKIYQNRFVEVTKKLALMSGDK